MSYYTIRLANAFSAEFDVSVIPMRNLLPRRLYPGRDRVGAPLTTLAYDAGVTVLPGVDWYWFPGMLATICRMWMQRPQAVVFQWWTGTALHSYLALALAAKVVGADVVIEFHEVLDTGEDRMPLVRRYVGLVAPLFVGLASAFVIHSEADREPLMRRYSLGRRPCLVMPHGPYDHVSNQDLATGPNVRRAAPPDAINILYFGVIRPFKGLEDLVRAFDDLDDDQAAGYWLTVVGETWEGWDVPARAIESSRHRERITFVNRYVDDREVAAFFAGADAVALPYHRSSASGPAHVTMSAGLPLIITAVGGLPAAVEGYEGALLVPPSSPADIRRAILDLPRLRGRRFADPHSWKRTVAGYGEILQLTEHRAGSPAGRRRPRKA